MIHTNGTSFAQLLRSFRERRGLTQRELARRANVDPTYPCRLEGSLSQPPGRRVVSTLASALELAPVESDTLLVTAGYAPSGLLEADSPERDLAIQTMVMLVGVLLDQSIPVADRTRFATIVELAATQCALRAARPGAQN